MKTIEKYQLGWPAQEQITMPRGAQLLTVGMRDGLPCLWALVETDQPDERRQFIIYTTEQALPSWPKAYVGTIYSIENVLHVFEVT